jgi:hypothetical protein
MNSAFASLVAIIFIIIAINFFMLYLRLKRDRHPKITKAAVEEKEASEWREKEIKRRIDSEQADAVKFVELQNKTFELYEQVRNKKV